MVGIVGDEDIVVFEAIGRDEDVHLLNVPTFFVKAGVDSGSYGKEAVVHFGDGVSFAYLLDASKPR